MRIRAKGGGGGGGTPSGWPVGFFDYGPPYSVANKAGPANTLEVYGIGIGWQVLATNITVTVNTADAAGLYDIGLYNASGSRVAHIGAQALPATGVQTFAISGGAVTLNPGLYFFAWTGNGNVAFLTMGGGAGNVAKFCLSYSHLYGSSTGGVLPATITPPTQSPSNEIPVFMLS